MRVYVLECELFAPFSTAEVFEIFENPYNLVRITPPWLNLRVTSRERVVMREGAGIEYGIRWLGIPIGWKTVIAEYQPPFRFVDEQERGPYTLWRHTHTFHPRTEGTLVSDRVEYALPLGALGRAMHSLVVARQLKQIFKYRQAKLTGILGGDTRTVREPAISVA